MRTFLILLGLLPILASAQEIPQKLLDRFPVLEELPQNSPSSSPDEYLLRAQHRFNWNEDVSQWVAGDSTEYYYNEFGEWEEIIRLRWDTNAWVNNSRTLYIYVMDTLLATSTTQSWDGSNWVADDGSSRTVIAYDESGNETSLEMFYWNGDDWSASSGRYTSYFAGTNRPDTMLHKWEVFQGEGPSNYEMDIYELYNSNGDPVIYYNLFWDIEAEAWYPPDRYTYTYNSGGDLVQRIMERQQVDQQWELARQELYTYNEEGRLTESLFQNHNGFGWEDYRRFTYEYNDAGYLSLVLFELLEPYSEVWEPYLRATYEYDQNGNAIYFLFEQGSEGVIENFLDITNTYYEDIQQLATETVRFWSEEQWVNNDSVTYYYQLFTDTEEKPLIQPGALEVFPNPAYGQINLKVGATELQGEGVRGALYNSTGQIVRRYTLGQEIEQLSLANLPPGTYWLKVSNGATFAVEAVVVKE